jgi:hypothetical protein
MQKYAEKNDAKSRSKRTNLRRFSRPLFRDAGNEKPPRQNNSPPQLLAVNQAQPLERWRGRAHGQGWKDRGGCADCKAGQKLAPVDLHGSASLLFLRITKAPVRKSRSGLREAQSDFREAGLTTNSALPSPWPCPALPSCGRRQ